ncbi:hypothetical protein BGW38_002335 [Lunasporangiospora selenospora]|uniref:Calnexin n=1 Tax=Lunasporangiospora selenospora TaxID=979761 RepID=A0A9P6KDI0_9FUNG|nr:hypothetical protein BGW38_002335 [Lunasporangiospora selenospora]
MTRILPSLVTLLALSSAISLARAHEDQATFSSKEDLPEFKPTKIKAPFLEQFTNTWAERWTASEATKETTSEDEVFAYVGNWKVEEPSVYPGIKNDLGLVAKSPAAHHAISASLPTVVDNKDKTLVVQYEVKAQDGLECGGAYMKLLTDSPEGIKFKEFSNDTPYTIMFGPDKCGSTNKVHFIFRHRNPKTGLYEEKHLQSAPMAKIGPLSNLYTLIVRPDQTFDVKINGESVSSGSLLENFHPSVNPPKLIDDLTDSKPSDWVEDARISDSKATKPDDWDEDAPARILDEEAIKPANWLEDELAEIPDPEAEKPEDWDDDEDGDWIPTSVPNPKCENNGCGKWTRPFKSNPAYKGKWTAPLIDNPDYKGIWAPRKIPNPDFFEDLYPSNFDKIGAVGFEIWTMQKDILFDNIYIGHSEEDASAFAAETWEVKYASEKKQEEVDNPRPNDLDGTPVFKEDPVGFVTFHLREFIDLAREDPLNALHSRPLVAAAIAGVGGVALALILILVGLVVAAPKPSATARAKAKKTDEPTPDDKDTGSSKAAKKEDENKDGDVRKRAARTGDDE